jgi:hypothetical protein
MPNYVWAVGHVKTFVQMFLRSKMMVYLTSSTAMPAPNVTVKRQQTAALQRPLVLRRSDLLYPAYL